MAASAATSPGAHRPPRSASVRSVSVRAASGRTRVHSGTSWTLELPGAVCQPELFSTGHTFSSSDASGDAGTYNRNALKMTWTSGPAAGDVYKARFDKRAADYQGRVSMGDASAAPAFLVPAATVVCSVVGSAPIHSSIVLGAPDSDTATVTGRGPAPTGTVSFSVCGPGATSCTAATGTSLGAPVALAGATAIPGGVWSATAPSPAITPPTTGTYCFVATYSGDTAYPSGSDGSPADECFTVTPVLATPTITTTVPNPTIVLGTSTTDTATLTAVDGAVAPSGTISFAVCGPETSTVCTSTAAVGSPVVLSLLSNTATVATSVEFTPPTTGVYCFSATYSGDAFYASVSDDHSPPAECVTVKAAPPAAIALGSPENSIGTGDLSLGVGSPTNIWMAVNGYCTSKENGDELLSGFDATFTGQSYECAAIPEPQTPYATTNFEYDPSGYLYDIETPVQSEGTLTTEMTVSAYDPSYNPAACAAGGGETPDNSLGQANTSITTSFALYYNPTPLDPPSAADLLSTATFGTNDAASCGKWVPIGTIPAGAANGTYQLQVATQAGEANSQGTNGYGLEVNVGAFGAFQRCSTIANPGWSNPDANNCPVIQGHNFLSVYAKNGSNTGTFYLADVDSAYDGKTMEITLFDPG
ncbi:MAG TPA: hypothetical protein VNC61_14885, partial [Acidimicrobiales bacterium]|nr:hypothetical protein [Acidimicrobiales bacterium]